jgi:hypothetical protein
MKKIILFGSPIILMLEILIINFIFDLLRQPSDIAVLVGITLICLFAFLNYLLINFIYKQFKTK